MDRRRRAVMIIAFGAFFAGYFVRDYTVSNSSGGQVEQTNSYKVERVVDGDTVDLEEGIEILLKRIRVLGVDTPERGEPYYNEATEALEEIVMDRPITLEKDPSNNLGKYGRPLRYIFVDDVNVTVEMVRMGFGKVYMTEGLKYEKDILEAQEEAQKEKRGIWKE